jgi:hypothetical protein
VPAVGVGVVRNEQRVNRPLHGARSLSRARPVRPGATASASR